LYRQWLRKLHVHIKQNQFCCTCAEQRREHCSVCQSNTSVAVLVGKAQASGRC
jgi:hypothetical protein